MQPSNGDPVAATMPAQVISEVLTAADRAPATPFDDLASIVALYEQRIFRFLLISTRDNDIAQTLTQETFLRAWTSRDTFREDCSVATWLIRIATNVFLEQRRRGDAQLQAQTQALSDEAELQMAAGLMAQADHVLSLSDTVALSLDMQRALDMLSEAERQAIVLSYWGDLSHAEAALALGCPLGTLKTHLLRGRAKLETALAAWAPRQPLEQCK